MSTIGACHCMKHWSMPLYECASCGHTNQLDIDECSAGLDNCSENANCTDTIGSFMCMCDVGYSGDGIHCEGTHIIMTQTASYTVIVRLSSFYRH